METKTRFTVDSEHCRQAADELYEILRAQERAFVARWHAARGMSAIMKIGRVFGMVVSLLGLLFVCAFLYFDTTAWATQPTPWTIPLFVAFTAVFVFQPQLVARIGEWSLRQADKRARRHADKGLRQARKLAPYEADYDLKGDLLVYTRTKDGEWRFAWFRALGKFRARGVAIQGENVTAIFNRPSSLMPSVLILQRGRDWTAQVLQEVGVTLERNARAVPSHAAPVQ